MLSKPSRDKLEDNAMRRAALRTLIQFLLFIVALACPNYASLPMSTAQAQERRPPKVAPNPSPQPGSHIPPVWNSYPAPRPGPPWLRSPTPPAFHNITRPSIPSSNSSSALVPILIMLIIVSVMILSWHRNTFVNTHLLRR